MKEIILYSIIYFLVGAIIWVIDEFIRADEVKISDVVFSIIAGGIFGVISIPIWLLYKFCSAKFWGKKLKG